MSVYRKEVRWRFVADGEEWAIAGIADDRRRVTVQYAEKGFGIIIELIEGFWRARGGNWGFTDVDLFAIEAYLNEHGLPEEESHG